VNDLAFERALAESVEEVLEKMFYIGGLEKRPVGRQLPEDQISALLTFAGDPSGSLKLAISRGSARSIAADFLGEDEAGLTEQQVGEVVCELANMICGAMLSRVESATLFRISAPRIISDGQIAAPYPLCATHGMAVGAGALRVNVYADTRVSKTTRALLSAIPAL
jgi:CheY-specific phosphatase CheX